MPFEFVVRTAEPNDAVLIGNLLEQSYPALMRPNYDEDVLRAALPLMTVATTALLSSGTYYLVKDANEGAIGCGGWTRERPGGGKIDLELAHIRHFCTHPDWLRRGIGRAIYARCESEARSRAVRRFECYASLNSEQFYKALGFESVKEIEVPLAQATSFPAILMERLI